MGFSVKTNNSGVTPAMLATWTGRNTRQMPSGLRMAGCFDPYCQSEGYWRTSLREEQFRCWGCGKHGDTVQAAMLLWGVSKAQALQRLEAEQAKAMTRTAVANTSARVTASEQDDRKTHEALQTVIQLVMEQGMHEETRSLLWHEGIANEVIDEAQSLGLIAGLPSDPVVAKDWLEACCGKSLLQEAGLWQKGNAYPAAAFRPLWSVHGPVGQASLEVTSFYEGAFAPSLHYGEVKTPFWWPTATGLGLTHICASPLDALRLRSMESQPMPIMGLPGMSSWQKAGGLKPWFDAETLGQEVVIAFGNTHRAEQQAYDLYVRLMTKKGVIASVMDMPEGYPTLKEALQSSILL